MQSVETTYSTIRVIQVDKVMPKNDVPLCVRCKKVMGRVSPKIYWHPSNDEASIGKENEGVIETDLGEFLGEM